jgi:cAMP-specific phosphodiesterase 4
MRKRIVDCVLATDMSYHTKQYQYLKIKGESHEVRNGHNVESIIANLSKAEVFGTQQEFLNITLHTADISNPTKPWMVYQIWADRVMNEFWAQGDEEKKLGMTLSFLCDRKTTKVPNAQIGFMDGIVLPLLSTFVSFFPGLNFLLENCKQNREIFIKQKEQEELLEKTIGTTKDAK